MLRRRVKHSDEGEQTPEYTYSMSSGHAYGLMEEYIFGPTIDPSLIAGEISPPYPPTSRTEVKPAKSVFSRSLDILAPARAAEETSAAYPRPAPPSFSPISK